MSARFYLTTSEKDPHTDALELQTYFCETLEVDAGPQKLRFATVDQMSILKNLSLLKTDEQADNFSEWVPRRQKG